MSKLNIKHKSLPLGLKLLPSPTQLSRLRVLKQQGYWYIQAELKELKQAS